jgi:hypothetical protein
LIVLLLMMYLSFPVAAADMPPDGRYLIEVTLSGGSGRAQVASPAELMIANGVATARIIWSSPYYESMLVDGVTYSPINADGNSTFEIPVLPDTDIAVRARTVAMSTPHEIDYTLRFDFETVKSLENEKTGLTPFGIGVITAVVVFFTGVGLLAVVPKRMVNGHKTADRKQE